MRKIATIARREYQALVRTKAFVISLVVMPIFMCGAIVVQIFLQDKIDTSEKTIVVLDGTGRLLAPLQAMAQLRNGEGAEEPGKKPHRTVKIEAGPPGPVTDDVRYDLSERIRRDEIFAFLEIDANALKPSDDSSLMQLLRKIGVLNPTEKAAKNSPPERSQSEKPPADKSEPTDNPPANKQLAAADEAHAKPGDSAGHDVPVHLYMQSITYNEISYWLTQAVNQAAFALRLEDAGLNPAAVAAAACPVDYQELGPYTRSNGGEIHKGDQGSRGLNFFIPFALIMLMFMSIMIVCQPMLTSVIEEKQQRIAEVLLGSASPFQLMMGKLIGNAGVALTIVAVYLVGGYFLAQHYGYTDMLPVRLLGWFIGFEVLACLLFGAVFIGIGAACTEIKEAQSLMMPVMILVVFPLMVWVNVLQEPLSNFAAWVSLFPPATPMLMMLRLAASPMVPLWQPVLGIALTLATTLAAVFAAGRVFRIGLLVQGKAPKLAELAGWILRG
jgi:ABC-2 type transport system permease protein